MNTIIAAASGTFFSWELPAVWPVARPQQYSNLNRDSVSLNCSVRISKLWFVGPQVVDPLTQWWHAEWWRCPEVAATSFPFCSYCLVPFRGIKALNFLLTHRKQMHLRIYDQNQDIHLDCLASNEDGTVWGRVGSSPVLGSLYFLWAFLF